MLSSKEQKGKWVLKIQPDVQDSAQSTKRVPLPLDEPPKKATWQEKEKWEPKLSSLQGHNKNDPTPIIKERAKQLQALLHGKNSLQ